MISEILGRSWDAYKRNFWEIIAASLIVGLIVIGIIILSAIPLFGVIVFAGISGSASASLAVSGSVITAFSILFIGMVIAIIAGTALGAGLVRFYADALKGKAEIGKIFSTARERFWSILGANILRGLILLPLFAVLLAPPFLMMMANYLVGIEDSPSLMTSSSDIYQQAFGNIIVMLWLLLGSLIFFLIAQLFAFADWAVVLSNLRAAESVKKSFSVVKENYLEFLVLAVVLAAISVIASFIPILGGLINFFVVAPITGLAYTVFYLDKTGVKEAAASKKPRARKSRIIQQH